MSKGKTNYIFRSLRCLKPYWHLVAGSYAIILISNGANIAIPRVIRGIVDDGIRGGVGTVITTGVIALLALALGRGVCTFLSGIWTESASQSVAFDIRNRFHEKLQSLSFSFHDESETGQLLSRSVGDVDRIRFLTGRAILHLVQISTLIVGVVISMLQINTRLALATFVFVPALGFSAWWFSNKIRPLSLLVREREADLTSKLEQNLRGARIVKAFAKEESENEAFREKNGLLLDKQLLSAKLRSFFMPLTQLIAQIGILVILIYGGKLAMDGKLTIGELVAFSTYVTQLLAPVRRFGWILTSVAQASASAERIFEILDLESDVEELPDAKVLGAIEGRISFEGVSFSYSRSSKILDDLSFVIEPGEKVALLGGTGSGKSSIINLIPRFYDPQVGTIRMDGLDLRDLTLKSIRDHIGTVLQDTTLFAASVKENIAFGRPNASMEDIVRAAKAARADDFIQELPKQYDSYVGERGITLSGGQKQRLSIARAILKNPEILILDDATSSVDTETEHQIQDALEELMKGKTSIIIAQRLSTVRDADKVFVMEKGRIAARGVRQNGQSAHDQLLKESGLYAEIFFRQLRPDTAKEAQK
jgi:ABC-type multidrug transport system fused ATPase/permease subunit